MSLLATFPNAYTDGGLVTYPSTPLSFPITLNQTTEIVGGLVPQTYSGKVAMGPGTSDPLLWTRGSLFNLGYSGTLAPRGSVGEATANGTFWDPTKAWGNPGFLPRLPNSLIITNVDPSVLAGVADNLAYWNSKGIAVYVSSALLGSCSALWVGVPVAAVGFNVVDTGGRSNINGGQIGLCLPTTTAENPRLFRGGKTFVASQASPLTAGYVAGITDATIAFQSNPGNVSGATLFSQEQPVGLQNFLYVLLDRIANDIGQVSSIASDRFQAFVNNAYYDQISNPFGYYFLDNTPWPELTSAVTGALFSNPVYRLRNWNSSSGTLWEAMFADIVAFFGV